MNAKLFSEAMSEVGEKYYEESAAYHGKKRGWVKWSVMAACLCLVVVGSLLFNSNKSIDFNSLVNNETEDILIVTSIPIDEWMVCYQQVSVSGSKLEQYVGNEYLKTGSLIWYLPDGIDNLKYLIRQDEDNSLTLWMFRSFAIEEGETYTYGDVLSTIYGVDSADDIVSITTSPLQADNTSEGKAIQEEVGTQTYTDRDDIATFYNIVKDVVCYGEDTENPANNTRFSYSFSTENSDTPTSEETTYGTRCILLEFQNGTILDSWKYSALSGSFFEYGGIFTEPLEENDVYALNDIFGIK